MQLLVDAQALQTPKSRHRGVGRYARNFLHALAALRPAWSIEVVQNAALDPVEPGDLPSAVRVTTFDPPLPVSPRTRTANERFFGDWIAARGPDICLELSFFEEQAIIPQWTGVRPRLAGIAYDLIPLLFHSRYLAQPGEIAAYAHQLRQFAAADRILAISEATRSDVLRLMRWDAARVVTILGAAEHDPPPSDDAEARLVALGIDRPFVVCVAGADPRKNIDGTLAAFAALPSAIRASHLLVIVCALSDTHVAPLRELALRLGIEQAVRFTRFISDADLHLLYACCAASVFLSFYEGLGLPVLEALRAGAPVAASDRSSVPEFCDPSARLVDPADPAAAARAIEALLAGRDEAGDAARRAFAAQFTWPRTAALAASALEGMVEAAPPRTARPRSSPLRIAWVSPLPPTPSGISDYSVELLARMPAALDISLVIAPEATLDGRVARGRPVLRPDDLAARADAFDLCVYHLGNSAHHLYMLDLLRRHAGLLVLHDLYLGGLALHAHAARGWPGGLAEALEDEGHPTLASQVRRGEIDHAAIATGAPLSAGLIARSEGVVVHSTWSLSRVRQLSAVPAFRIRHGIPVPAPIEPAAARRVLGLDPQTFLVVTLGEVTRAKRVDRLIAAVAQLPEAMRSRTTLRIVGSAPEELAAELLDVAGALGIRGQVSITGRVPLDAFGLYASAASACVQLRHPFRGETSGALMRALAAGGALIVSDAGSLAETPASAALRVPVGEDEVSSLCRALLRLDGEPRLVAMLREAARTWAETAHSLETAAREYGAAIELTAERRRRRDGVWLDAASAALASAGARVGHPPAHDASADARSRSGDLDAVLHAWADARRRAWRMRDARP